MELNQDERQAILGTLLGDSSISTPPGGKHPRLICAHSGRQAQWAEHKAALLARLGMKAIQQPDARYTGGTKIAMATPCLPCLDAIRVLVAPGGVKRITREWLDGLGELGLAWWIGDDGSSNGGRSLTIATHGFPRDDVELAAEWFRATYGPVTVNSGRGHSWLYISAAARREILPIVEPHIPECMRYKLQACRTREYRQWELTSAPETVSKLVEELGLDRYPTKKEFAGAGLIGLHNAIRTRFGGQTAMAARLNLRMSRTYWDVQSARNSVRELVENLRLERYPTRGEFAAARLEGLHDAITCRLGGHEAMAARLDLTMRCHRWDAQSAAAAVQALVEKLALDRYPTPKEFAGDGMSGVYGAIWRRLGGHARMASRLGLARSSEA